MHTIVLVVTLAAVVVVAVVAITVVLEAVVFRRPVVIVLALVVLVVTNGETLVVSIATRARGNSNHGDYSGAQCSGIRNRGSSVSNRI
jgi:uncharacterized membrane protein YgcG